MQPIIAIRYIDALYFKKDEKFSFDKFKTHVAVGKLVSFNNHIMLCFTERGGLCQTGLLIPKEAIILEKENMLSNVDIHDLQSKIGSDIGLFWKDIVHFVKGKMPNHCPVMYSEGEFFSSTTDAIIVKNPETIITGQERPLNHPPEKASFVVIPKSIITDIEFYDKKL